MIINELIDEVIGIILLCKHKTVDDILNIILNIPKELVDRFNRHGNNLNYAYRDKDNNTHMYRIYYIDNGIKIDYSIYDIYNKTNRWIVELRNCMVDCDFFDSICSFSFNRDVYIGNKIVSYNETCCYDIEDYEDDYIVIRIKREDIFGVDECIKKINTSKLYKNIDIDMVKKKIRKHNLYGGEKNNES